MAPSGFFFTTTTIRERVKASYWDTLNLKALNPKITRSYLVYPDSINPEEKKKAERKNARIIVYSYCRKYTTTSIKR